ncbi:MAG: hypothetical protein VX640_02110 [Pseudomonadota bacterium]|nr:hypothetical protein [Pseudomonadota bacterium]
MDNQTALQTLMADIGAHGGTIQLVIFAATLVFLSLAGLMANRLFSMLEEARLLYWRASQHLEAARSFGGAAGRAPISQRLSAAAATHRRKLATAGRKKDLLTG